VCNFPISGLINASDAVEVSAISFILPSAEKDLGLTSSEKGWLTSIIFLGMMIGTVSQALHQKHVFRTCPHSHAHESDILIGCKKLIHMDLVSKLAAGGYAWGAFADAFGRRRCLMVSLAVNSMFGVFSAFARGYYSLLLFRFLSGLGVGGSIPVVFTYFCEFLPSAKRGSFMVILARCACTGRRRTAMPIITPEAVVFRSAKGMACLLSAGHPRTLPFSLPIVAIMVAGALCCRMTDGSARMPCHAIQRGIPCPCSFWMVGSIFVAGLAWAIIPQDRVYFEYLGTPFTSWRMFMALAAVPSGLCVFGMSK
jgi:MFS family permease